jgi:hypothetical protein
LAVSSSACVSRLDFLFPGAIGYLLTPIRHYELYYASPFFQGLLTIG